MTAYWFDRASSDSALAIMWLKRARLGPVDTSYHDMNHMAGLSKGMSSWYSPPWYHLGSLGFRLIMSS